MNESFARARTFIYRHARPLDLARWQFHFENGSKDAVITALAAYQNADGGFAHALEADAWNPNSAPIQTWCATQVLQEIDFDDAAHPVVQGILRYLESGADFDGRHWKCVVESNNDYPHAQWWHWGGDGETDDNPTASLAGFIVRFAPKGSTLHELGRCLVRKAAERLLKREECGDMHVIGCYIAMVEYIRAAGETDLMDISAAEAQLRRFIDAALTKDVCAWERYYACRPSQFMLDRESVFYAEQARLAAHECDFIMRTQQEDGAWAIPWRWSGYPTQWAMSENWWKADMIIRNLRFLRGMGR